MNFPSLKREQSTSLLPLLLGQSLEQRGIYAVLELAKPDITYAKSDTNDIIALCVLDIPGPSIPREILSFFSSALTEITLFRIFKQYLHPNKYSGLIFLPSQEIFELFVDYYHEKCYSSLEPDSECQLRRVVSVSLQGIHHQITFTTMKECLSVLGYKDMIEYVSESKLLSPDEMEHIIAEQQVLQEQIDYQQSPSSQRASLVGSSPINIRYSPHSHLHTQSHSPGQQNHHSSNNNEICTLCLEPFVHHHPTADLPTSSHLASITSNIAGSNVASGSMIVLYCHHRFHSLCLQHVENSLCPVCRYSHHSSSNDPSQQPIYSNGQHSGSQQLIGDRSSTAGPSCHRCSQVSGHHSSNSHSKDSSYPSQPSQGEGRVSHPNQELSYYPIKSSSYTSSSSSAYYAATTAASYAASSATTTAATAASVSTTIPPPPPPPLHPDQELWLCLICGLTSCPAHAEEHYLTSYHTYALCIQDTSRVYDYAGQGYVHRLVLQHNLDTDMDQLGGTGADAATDVAAIAGQQLEMMTAEELIQRCQIKTKLLELPSPDHTTSELSSSSSAASASVSITAVSASTAADQLPAAYYRPRHPPLSEPQETRIISQKLEHLITQYNAMLTWRLQANREVYEQQIVTIWQQQQQQQQLEVVAAVDTSMTSQAASNSSSSSSLAATSASASATSSTSATSATANMSATTVTMSATVTAATATTAPSPQQWLKQIKSSLLQEKQKLLAQTSHLKEKLAHLQSLDEVSSLQAMTKQLQEVNQPAWEKKVRQAQLTYQATEMTFREEIPKLQKKVDLLMMKLEETSSSASSSSTSSASATAGKGGKDGGGTTALSSTGSSTSSVDGPSSSSSGSKK